MAKEKSATAKVLNLCLVTRNIDDFKLFTEDKRYVFNWSVTRNALRHACPVESKEYSTGAPCF